MCRLRRSFVGPANRRPVAVVVWQQWYAHAIGDRRLLQAGAAVQGQSAIPRALGAEREQPSIFVLERQGRRKRYGCHGGNANPAPVNVARPELFKISPAVSALPQSAEHPRQAENRHTSRRLRSIAEV